MYNNEENGFYICKWSVIGRGIRFMKIINECKDSVLVKILGGFIISIISWICVDISGLVNKIIILFQLSTDVQPYIILLDFVIKIAVCLTILLLYILSYILLGHTGSVGNKKYYAIDIVKYIKKHKLKLSKVVIFGYSLSFIESIRVFLYDRSINNVTVDLIVPSEEYIEKNIVENKPITTRIEMLNGRLKDWESLENENRIKKLNIRRYPVLPTEYGILLNDEILFLFYYIWERNESKYKLVKAPLEKRGMIKLTLKNQGELFEYYYHKLQIAIHN